MQVFNQRIVICNYICFYKKWIVRLSSSKNKIGTVNIQLKDLIRYFEDQSSEWVVIRYLRYLS